MSRFGGIPVDDVPVEPKVGGRFGGIPVDADPQAEMAQEIPQLDSVSYSPGVAPAAIAGDVGEQAGKVGMELIAAINRGAIQAADLPASIYNAISGFVGSESRAAKIGDIPAIEGATTGNYMEPGLAKDVIAGVGELAAPAPPLLTGLKKATGVGKSIDPVALKASQEAIYAPAERAVDNIPGLSSPAEAIRISEAGGDAHKYLLAPQSPEFADKVLKGGKVVDDVFAKQAIKQGFDPGFIGMIKTVGKETRDKFAEMAKIVEIGRRNNSYAREHSPWDVAGRSAKKRIDDLRKINLQAGKEVNQAAKSLAGKQVDYTPAMDSFMGRLSEEGVMLLRNDAGEIVPDFSRSVFRTKKPQKLIKEVFKILDTKNPIDAREVHIAKKAIDDLVNWGKEAGGNAGRVEGIAKSLRGDLNKVLGDAFPAYREANTKYKDTLDALDSVSKGAGVKLSPDSPEFSKAVGIGIRRILSNAQSGALLREAITNLDDVAAKYGKTYGDNIKDQATFASDLEGIFGSATKTSLQGVTEKAAERAVDLAAGQQTMYGAAAGAAKDSLRAIRGINDENALKALQAILKENY